MRALTLTTVALASLSLMACGQTKKEAQADLAAKEAAANPAPVEAPAPMMEEAVEEPVVVEEAVAE
jgi:hypothetical protein